MAIWKTPAKNCVRMSGQGLSRVSPACKHKDIFMYATTCWERVQVAQGCDGSPHALEFGGNSLSFRVRIQMFSIYVGFVSPHCGMKNQEDHRDATT
jgi:hypothetical protein